MAITEAAERAVLYKAIDYVYKDPDKNIKKLMNTVNKVLPDNVFPVQRAKFTEVIADEDNNWYRLICKIFDLNPEVSNKLIKILLEGTLFAWSKQEANRDKYECNIPWAILLDPTSACNLRCTGCWAAEYGHQQNLTYDEIDSIINQGVELGTRIFIYTGGEPLVRKKDLIKLCEAHQDCAFLSFTNGTLIDDEFCQDMVRVGNFVPAISAEGTESTTDARRGEGVYNKIENAMALLRKYKLPFGISTCWTKYNVDAVTSEENFDWMIDEGALFCWFFHYMPVGRSSGKELLPTPEQRIQMYNAVRSFRKTKSIFTLDFQNDGEFTGGCIAGGRRYLHINAAGDVEPCVFIHYSGANIRDMSLLDCLRQPLFMQYYDNMPFNDNYLRPCPMLENPDRLPEMVAASGAHSTDLVEPESPEQLREKTKDYAEAWAPVADDLWFDKDDPYAPPKRLGKRTQGMADSDVHRFEKQGRTLKPYLDGTGINDATDKDKNDLETSELLQAEKVTGLNGEDIDD